MAPWGAIIRAVLTALGSQAVARKLADPNLINKLSNSGVMRGVARMAVRARLQAERRGREIEGAVRKELEGAEKRGKEGGGQADSTNNQGGNSQNGSAGSNQRGSTRVPGRTTRPSKKN